MKRNIIFFVVFLIATFVGNDMFAQSVPSRNDSIAATLRLHALQSRREKLQNEIKMQDAKRNKQVVGVAPETLEEMNDVQDSICLALRSELVDIVLEIKEVSPEVSSPALLQQYNNLVSKPTQENLNSGSHTDQMPIKQPEKQPEK